MGKFRRTPLSTPTDIRPTSLRVKKSIFDIFGDEVIDLSVLDLFAGSGGLGIEALSCGAKEAVFIDNQKKCIDKVTDNIRIIGIDNQAQGYTKEAMQAIEGFARLNKQFSLIFIDPPYYAGIAKKALQALDEYDILSPPGYIVVLCSNKEEVLDEYSLFSLIVSKKYGQTRLLIYRKNESSDLSRDI